MKKLTFYHYISSPGGLAEEVDEKVLHAAFIPFGDITDIQIPLDYETGKIFYCDLFLIAFLFPSYAQHQASAHWFELVFALSTEKHRGFAFIEFELAEVSIP